MSLHLSTFGASSDENRDGAILYFNMKLKIFLLIMFSLGFFVIGTKIVKSEVVGGGGKAAGSAAAGGVIMVKLDSPLKNNVTDFRVILSNLINAVMGFLGSVTLLVFVYGGFLWLISAGSPEKIKKGSQAMLWAVVGLFLIFGSYAIMGIILQGIGAKQQAEQSSGSAEATRVPTGVSLEP